MNPTACLVGLLLAFPALLHPGGLDANGGHYNRKTGSYRSHRSAAPVAPVDPAAAAGIATNAAAAEKAFWLTSSSGIRHNKGCRYFNASQGRVCGASEGRACKICGG